MEFRLQKDISMDVLLKFHDSFIEAISFGEAEEILVHVFLTALLIYKFARAGFKPWQLKAL